MPNLSHTFEPARTPGVLRRYEKDSDWRLPAHTDRYPRCSTDRETTEKHNLERVTLGHPLFEAIRRHTRAQAVEVLSKGPTFQACRAVEPPRRMAAATGRRRKRSQQE